LVRENADTLAAVVIEPIVQCAAGMITAPEGYLRRVREVTQDNNVLLIADEVAVGFGRTGTMFACDQEKVVPDILCMAKGLTAGYLPLAATLTTDTIYEAFLGRPEEGRTFYHGHTYTGNPLGAAVALANLELFESRQVLSHLPSKIDRLSVHLQKMKELPLVGDTRQRGLIAGIELVADKVSKQRLPAHQRVAGLICRRARDQGVLIRPLGDILVIMPPLAIDLTLLDRLCDVLYNCIKEVGSERELYRP
jgi:adenosylmethionine-8-amino-7-oxononanoate aminotransferase